MECSDVVADTIVKYHFRRLAGDDPLPKRKALATEFSKSIDEHLEKHNLSKTLYNRMDRITDLLDQISFRLCFDVPASGEASIFPRNGEETEVAVRFEVDDGVIHVDPWTFSVDEHVGYLVAYHVEGYPKRLDPFILPYRLQRK